MNSVPANVLSLHGATMRAGVLGLSLLLRR
jgi:hypothetical protein